ncbi:MAG: antitoxin family protein [Desulfurococcales archaeon]|nr:antitoxin family protein [Desulfurococcales archaeon]
MSLIVKAIYEKGVLKLLENIDLKDGEEVIVIVKRKPNIDKFVGMLGKASAKELEAYEEEVYRP